MILALRSSLAGFCGSQNWMYLNGQKSDLKFANDLEATLKPKTSKSSTLSTQKMQLSQSQKLECFKRGAAQALRLTRFPS